jgi:hypothetical protein
MTWDQKSLWDKARLFMEKASKVDKSSSEFGLWSAMGLELLARAAIAKISPTLLADPDKDHRHLLHVLGLGSGAAPKSIAMSQVLALCKSLINSFTEDEHKIATALINRRNEELHSGSAAFAEFRTQQWISGFYRCCKILAESQGESLLTLFGGDEAKGAEVVLLETQGIVAAKAKEQISAHRRVYENKDKAEQDKLTALANEQSDILSHQKHHRVKCPACASTATVQGDPFGPALVENTETEVVVRQSVMPTKFQCLACGLKLSGYGELMSAGVADHFTHRTNVSPEDYYGLVDPEDGDTMRDYAENHGYYQFSND